MTTILRSLLVGSLLLTACKGGDKAGDKSAPAATPASSSEKSGADLTGGAKAPAGITLTPTPVPFGTASLPTSDGWAVPKDAQPMQVEGKDGTVIMFQSQDGIQPDQLDDYLHDYNDVQKRDAPKYAETGHTKGTVAGATAARVEGTFDNGTKFKTRDYIVITKSGKLAAISGRAPVGPAADQLPALVDAIAASIKL